MDGSISRFWDTFNEKTKLYGNKDEHILCNVMHVEEYSHAHKGIKLMPHTELELNNYFKLTGGKKIKLSNWQYKQMIDVLRNSFVGMIKVRCANKFLGQDRK